MRGTQAHTHGGNVARGFGFPPSCAAVALQSAPSPSGFERSPSGRFRSTPRVQAALSGILLVSSISVGGVCSVVCGSGTRRRSRPARRWV